MFLALVAVSYGQTVTQFPNGISTGKVYDYDSSAGWLGSYYLDVPTLTANDTFVGAATTQTLTNKTLTSPTITGATTVTGGTFTGSTLAGAFLSMSSKVLSLADWYLSAADKLITFWTLSSGSNGTNYMIVCSDTEGRLRVIRNGTNGSVVIKEAGQTGVTIATGKTAVVIHNGTDYVRVSGDATH
jgi:hypothetical protein